MKKALSILLLVVLLLSAAGCGGGGANNVPANSVPDPEPVGPGPDTQQQMMQVVSKDGKPLGSIDCRANCTAMDGGIIYSVFELAENNFTAAAEYHFFSKESNKDVLLGTLGDQGYEAVYTRTELGGKAYTLAIQGNPMDGNADKLMLLEFDIKAGTMKQYVVSEKGFPYAAMAVHKGRLLIMNHEMDEQRTDVIVEFDPVPGTMKKVISLPGGKDSLRSVFGAEDGSYVLRADIGSSETELFIDTYDVEYRKVSERSLNDIFLKAFSGMPGFEDRQDVFNELMMNVSCFEVIGGRYLVYENFGRMRMAADLQTGEVLFADQDLYSVSVGSGAPAVYRMDFEPESVEDPEICTISGGSLKKLDFAPSGKEKMIRNVSHSAGGTWLVLTADSFRITDGSAALYLWTEN